MRFLLRLVLLFSLIVVIALKLCASDRGTYTFLRNDLSPRSAALGGGYVTMTNDPVAIFYNPSGIASLDKTRISVGDFIHLLGINEGFVTYGTQIQNFGWVGGGIQYINYGSFNRTGPEGQDLGTFGAGELAISAAYASEFEGGLHYGAGVKFIYSSIAEVSSSGAALDVGVQYVAAPNRLLLGASLMNLGTQFTLYGNTREELPLDFTVGASIYPEHLPAIIQFNLHKLNEAQDSFSDKLKNFSVGVELSPAPNIQLRVGYDNERRSELKIGQGSGFAGFSLGGGISTELYTVDYAFNSFGSIGTVHRIGVTFGL